MPVEERLDEVFSSAATVAGAVAHRADRVRDQVANDGSDGWYVLRWKASTHPLSNEAASLNLLQERRRWRGRRKEGGKGGGGEVEEE